MTYDSRETKCPHFGQSPLRGFASLLTILHEFAKYGRPQNNVLLNEFNPQAKDYPTILQSTKQST
jgi:hypothetical protein